VFALGLFSGAHARQTSAGHGDMRELATYTLTMDSIAVR